jgi:copper transport protein
VSRRLVPVGALVLGALVWAAPAGAHASLTSSDPASGATLTASPETVALTFSEPPDPDLTTVELLDVGGTALATGDAVLDGPRTVRVPVTDPLPDGVYTVAWRVVSTVDGHLTSGRVVFGVGVTPEVAEPAPEAEVAEPTPGGIAARSLLYAGLFVVVAAAGIGLGAFGGRPRSLPVVAVGGAVLALAGALGLLVTEQRAVGVPMSDLLASSTGRPLVWLVIAVLVADALAVIAAAKEAWRPALWVAGTAAAAAMWVRASGGHAAAADPPLPQELLQTAHMVAAGLWIGGLVLLVLLLRETRGADAPVREVRRFSTVALGAVAVVVASGLARSFEELGGPLWTVDLGTTYGRALVGKVALSVALIAMGALNRRRSIPRLGADARPLRRVVGTETVVALGVVLLTANLTSAAPPAEAGAGTPTPAPVTAEGTDFATTTAVALTFAPGIPGPSTVEVRVTDPDTGASLAPDEVALRVRSVTRPDVAAETVALAAQGEIWAATTSAVSLAGTWSVTAIVTTGADATQVPLVVVTRAPESTTSVEVGPGLPTVTTTTFPDGTALQTYVDPALAGTNQIHATAFAPDGTEAALDDVAIVAIPEAGEPRRLEVTALGAGHVVANADLEAGDWRIDVVATTADGGILQATIDETVEAG